MLKHASFSRRQFLQTTTAVVAPTIVPASVLAKDAIGWTAFVRAGVPVPMWKLAREQ